MTTAATPEAMPDRHLARVLSYAGERPDLDQNRSDPSPRPKTYRVVSADDHFVEPATTFAGRLPSKLAGRAPRVERDGDVDWWVFEEMRLPVLGSWGVQTWEKGHWYIGPVTLDDFRPGVVHPGPRIDDMDVAGIEASVNFPSAAFGFAGQRFLQMQDDELAKACVRAYNDWVHDEWLAPYPQRYIGCQVTHLRDPLAAADEIRRNAARGFTSVTFSENPEKIGLPSIYSDHWDPFLRACEETGTVINLHVGSSSETLVPSTESPAAVLGVLFPVNAFAAVTDWLYAMVAVRFPRLRIVLSESGIGFVPMLLDRLRYGERWGEQTGWTCRDLSPQEVLARNYWFTTFFDPSGLEHRHQIGVDRIMLETDFPHSDSTWPDTQQVVDEQLRGFDSTEIDAITHANAAAVYRHDLAPA
jgi:predicted TIM-barrel fold metal-dependent hydrolase